MKNKPCFVFGSYGWGGEGIQLVHNHLELLKLKPFEKPFGCIFKMCIRDRYGGFGAKGLTRVPREGNKPPRIAETPSGILNSVGLQNPGVEHFAKHIMPILAEYDTNVIANMSGNTIEEYCEMAEILSDTDVAIIEMNISCPNVKHGGVAFGTDPKVCLLYTSRCV